MTFGSDTCGGSPHLPGASERASGRRCPEGLVGVDSCDLQNGLMTDPTCSIFTFQFLQKKHKTWANARPVEAAEERALDVARWQYVEELPNLTAMAND